MIYLYYTNIKPKVVYKCHLYKVYNNFIFHYSKYYYSRSAKRVTVTPLTAKPP
jgi:hypothetical protein